MISRQQQTRLLVTGGAGFIGINYLLKRLAEFTDAAVVNLDKLTYASNQSTLALLTPHPNYHFYHGDICDSALVARILRQHQINTIVHFAAETHVDRSIAEPDAFIETNIRGTYTLLEAAKQYWLTEHQSSELDCRFHHISTDEVFGSLSMHDPACLETTAYQPSSPYSASKAAADHLVAAYQRTYLLPTTLSHCTNNYGPYQHPEKLIPKVIQLGQQGLAMPVYGDGRAIRDWLFVEDHCDAINLILSRGVAGERYNIGGQCEMNNISMIQAVSSALGRPIAIQFGTDRPGHDRRYALNIEKIQRQLDWQPTTSLQQGLASTVAHYQN